MSEVQDGGQPAGRLRLRRLLLPLAVLSVIAAATIAFVRLAGALADARASAATLAGRLELSERGGAAAEALRGDLESAVVSWSDDETGRAWLSHCAFPVNSTPAGGAGLPADGRATLLLLARPWMFPGVAGDFPNGVAAVRIVAWFPAESPDAPALVSWESEPLVRADWLAALPESDRRDAVEALIRGGVRLAWSPTAAGPRTLDAVVGDVAAEEPVPVTLHGTARRWCGDAPGAPVLSRGLGHPAFYVAYPGAKRMEVHLTMEVAPEGKEAIRREFLVVAIGS